MNQVNLSKSVSALSSSGESVMKSLANAAVVIRLSVRGTTTFIFFLEFVPCWCDLTRIGGDKHEFIDAAQVAPYSISLDMRVGDGECLCSKLLQQLQEIFFRLRYER